MIGFFTGYADNSNIYNCPFCGEKIYERNIDGSASCENCGARFAVIETDGEDAMPESEQGFFRK